MINKIIKLVFLGLMFMIILSIGGYSIDSFSNEIHLKNPKTVLSPLVEQLPDIDEVVDIELPSSSGNNGNTENPDSSDTDTSDPSNPSTGENNNSENNNNSEGPNFFEDPGLEDPGPIGGGNSSGNGNSFVDENGNFIKHDIVLDSNSELNITHVKSIKVRLDDQEMELTSDNTVDFIKWLHTNYKASSKVELEIEKEPTTETPEVNPEEVKYNNVLENETDLRNLVASINIVDSLPDGDDYDRTVYEKPVQSYKLDGEKINRNNYAWQTSKWFDEDTFTYMCPYTGTIIHDLDDDKEDLDFGNLDYDHIVSLHVVERSCPDWWTEVERNNYAYDQCIGVDVLNSANRSKSDKTPSEWLPEVNVEDYCYHYLLICSKYELSMTQADLDVCYNNIITALENGETVEVLNTHISEWSK